MTASVAAGAFIAISWLERRRPLRARREDDLTHVSRNLAVAALTGASTWMIQSVLACPAATRRRRGLLGSLRLPGPVAVIAGVIALDYTLWWWHWLNHRVPLLWRFHLVHHVDLDLDSSTALRFHFGEMGLSVLFRALQMRILGPHPMASSLWQLLLFVSILFHHSNLRLDLREEGRLVRWVVTPRMHGIHHSDFLEETDSNWSSLLSVWDVLHGTFRFDIPEEAITIGVPAWQDPADVTLGKVVTLPFREQRDDWRDDEGRRRIARVEPSEILRSI